MIWQHQWPICLLLCILPIICVTIDGIPRLHPEWIQFNPKNFTASSSLLFNGYGTSIQLTYGYVLINSYQEPYVSDAASVSSAGTIYCHRREKNADGHMVATEPYMLYSPSPMENGNFGFIIAATDHFLFATESLSYTKIMIHVYDLAGEVPTHCHALSPVFTVPTISSVRITARDDYLAVAEPANYIGQYMVGQVHIYRYNSDSIQWESIQLIRGSIPNGLFGANVVFWGTDCGHPTLFVQQDNHDLPQFNALNVFQWDHDHGYFIHTDTIADLVATVAAAGDDLVIFTQSDSPLLQYRLDSTGRWTVKTMVTPPTGLQRALLGNDLAIGSTGLAVVGSLSYDVLVTNLKDWVGIVNVPNATYSSASFGVELCMDGDIFACGCWPTTAMAPAVFLVDLHTTHSPLWLQILQWNERHPLLTVMLAFAVASTLVGHSVVVIVCCGDLLAVSWATARYSAVEDDLLW
ncbi:hypothetical protein J8273_2938 [Carpediemonas membranifera]|uniref:Membrane-associated protein n=1 Tax=Carpediemonas membranifera TaxID=201153 RepID=A0A8J6AUX0_9EUKA|nr:hypothetical protein J8273_2938 [Carpediemonas membranifera]|eukprot:KAG9395371.1 hypothetical protein J8273_2938 [Carpediemonas membranifera]